MFIRLLFISLSVCSVFMSGCAGIVGERSVQENVFYSSATPKLHLKVNPDFSYLGKYKTSKRGRFEEMPNAAGPGVSIEQYVFGDIIDNNTLKRGAVIGISTVSEGYWLSDLISWLKYRLDEGFERINGKMYQTAVGVVGGVLINEAEDEINDRGFRILNCYLAKVFSKRFGGNRNTKVDILYFEDINYGNEYIYECKDWLDLSKFTKDQREHLEAFRIRIKASILMLDKDGKPAEVEVVEKSGWDR